MKIINAIAVAALRPIDRLTCTDVRAIYRTTASRVADLFAMEQEKYSLLSGVKLP